MIAAEDERAIAAVLLRYATGIDRRDWALFRTCFTEDCVGIYPGFGTWRGPDAITDFMREAHADLGPTLHRMSNFVIEGEGGNATARSYVDALLIKSVDTGEAHRAAGLYDDVLVRGIPGWQIARRAFTSVLIT
jgi:uncharacterized protein (TIGR02246 family)